MHRALAVCLLALGACEVCSDDFHSYTTNEAIGVVSRDRAAIMWGRMDSSGPSVSMTMVEANGTLLPPVRIAQDTSTLHNLTLGSTTVLWTPRDDLGGGCAQHDNAVQLTGLLVGATGATSVSVTPDAATWDSQVYANNGFQVFWVNRTSNIIEHRTLDERGVGGTSHLIAQRDSAYCVYAVTDDAGSIYLFVPQQFGPPYALRVDPATGNSQRVWTQPSGYPGLTYYYAFWFAGRLDLVALAQDMTMQVISIDPTTGMSDMHPIARLGAFFPATTSLFAADNNAIVELDANFVEVGRTQVAEFPFMGTLESDAVWLDSVPLDEMKRSPGHVDVVRGNHNGEVWREPVAADSEVVNTPVCNDRQYGPAGCAAAPGNTGLLIALSILGVSIRRRRR